MKVLHVVPTYLPAWRHGGPIRSVHGLCRALAARGHEVSVFTTDAHADGRLDVPTDREVDVDGVRVSYFPVGKPRRFYHSPKLREALRTRIQQFDIAHLHSVFLWPTLVAARQACRARVPYLVAPRGMLVRELFERRGKWRKSVWLRLFERRTLRDAAAIHATSELEALELRRFDLELPRMFVIPNGIDLEELAYREGSEISAEVREAISGGSFLLSLGRVSWKKGLDRVLRALPSVAEVAFVIAGNDEEGETERLRSLARECGVEERVRFVGPVEGASKAFLLERASAFVLPSHSENFGLAVLEAMAMGCPPVITRDVALAAVVEENEAGVVVDGEPAALAHALGRLLADPERRAALGRSARRVARERFGWPSIARQMEEAYSEVLGR